MGHHRSIIVEPQLAFVGSMHTPRGSHWLRPVFAPEKRWQGPGPSLHRVSGRAECFLQGQPRLWELTHIVAWTWAFYLGLTVNLVWLWHRFQGTWL